MAQLRELLEKEELETIKEVKEDLKEEASVKDLSEKAGKGSKAWIWVAAIIAAVLIIK